jgi:hypothetical protein
VATDREIGPRDGQRFYFAVVSSESRPATPEPADASASVHSNKGLVNCENYIRLFRELQESSGILRVAS